MVVEKDLSGDEGEKDGRDSLAGFGAESRTNEYIFLYFIVKFIWTCKE